MWDDLSMVEFIMGKRISMKRALDFSAFFYQKKNLQKTSFSQLYFLKQ